jgi:hypothetical protein
VYEPDPPEWSAPIAALRFDAAPTLPTRRRPRRGLWLATLVALLALVGGVVVAVTSYLSVPGPDGVVQDYFAALAGGDATSALGYGDVPSGDRSFLTAAVLQDQLAAAPITSVQVSPMAQGSVPVTYRLAGVAISDSVPVLKRSGSWRLRASAVHTSVSLAAAGQRAIFAGASVPTGQPLLFPGALPVRFDSPVLLVPAGSAVVRFAGSSTEAVAVQVSVAGQRAITTAMVTTLTSCITSATPAAACPVPSGTGIRAVPESLRGKVTGSPVVHVSVAPQADGKLSITGQVEVDGSYQSIDYENQASTKTGQLDVSFTAHSYAGDPTKIVLDLP